VVIRAASRRARHRPAALAAAAGLPARRAPAPLTVLAGTPALRRLAAPAGTPALRRLTAPAGTPALRGLTALAGTSALRGLAAHGGGIPVTGRRAGQRLARTELSKAIYHHQPSLTERVAHFLLTWLARLFRATQGLPGGWWGFVALVVLAVVLVTAVLARIGPVARAQRHRAGTNALGPARTAREHRDAAIGLAQAGDYAAAICERVRAIAAELDERGILMPRIGRTADEFAAEAGRALPPHAAGLLGAARLFDEVRYGQRPGTRPGYEQVADLDTRIGASAGRRGAARAPAQAGAGMS